MQQEKIAVEAIADPPVKFWHVYVDLVGPLPQAKDGCTFWLMAIDRMSCWPEAMRCVAFPRWKWRRLSQRARWPSLAFITR